MYIKQLCGCLMRFIELKTSIKKNEKKKSNKAKKLRRSTDFTYSY